MATGAAAVNETLADILKDMIASAGPISLERYMALALGHPKHGYYMKGTVFGAAGDFITAPEISQIFGELIGLWCADYWQRMGRPTECHLVELGPGRGTLLADALRAATVMPDFIDAIDVHLVETSPALRERQKENLPVFQPTWHADLKSLPAGPLIVIANEFFDALPMRQFLFGGEGWRERRIGVQDGQFVFVDAGETRNLEIAGLPETRPNFGDIFESAPLRQSVMSELTKKILRFGGVVLIIDYGHVRPGYGDSLQAVRRHRFDDPLVGPGEADITAHVDFAALAQVARDLGAQVMGPVTQGAFLDEIGLTQRLRQLCQGKPQDQQDDLRGRAERLRASEQMGEMFKVMAVCAPQGPAPAGFSGR